jgi:hypothetical protein
MVYLVKTHEIHVSASLNSATFLTDSLFVASLRRRERQSAYRPAENGLTAR